MATITISLSDEERRRLEARGEREGLTVEQMVRLCINDFIEEGNGAWNRFLIQAPFPLLTWLIQIRVMCCTNVAESA